MVYEKSDESHHSRPKRERPRSLVVVQHGRRASETPPSTHHSLPTGPLDEDTIVRGRLRLPSPSWKRPASQPGTPDDHAAVARSLEGRMPIEIETLPNAHGTSNGDKGSPQGFSSSPIPDGDLIKEHYDVQQDSLAIDVNPAELENGCEQIFAPPLGVDADPRLSGTWPHGEPWIEEGVHFARLLRKVRKYTDDVLLKRTEWRHEYDQLEHRRRFLNISTTDLMAALMYHFPDVLRDPSEQSSLHKSEDSGKVPGANTPSDERSPSDSNTDSSEKSSQEQETRKERSSATDSDIRASESNNIATLNRRYHDDYRAVQAQESKITRLADELSSLEYQLAIDLRTVQERMYAGDFVSELKSEAMNAPLAPSERHSRQTSEAELPPLVAQYFDMKGDVGIFQERLQECDFNYGEGVTERGFLRERGDPVVPSDEEFDYNYRTRRSKIEEDLRTAQDEVDILRQRCADAGYSLEDYRTFRPSMYTASTQQSGHAAALAHVPPEPLIHELRVGPFGPSVDTERHSTQRIGTWLREVEPDESAKPPEINPVEAEVVEHKVGHSLAAYEWKSFDLETFRHRSRSLEDQG